MKKAPQTLCRKGFEQTDRLAGVPLISNTVDKLWIDCELATKVNYMAEYSSTPLIKKLGIKETMKVMVLNMPSDYFSLLEADITEQFVKDEKTAELVHIFSVSKKELETDFDHIIGKAKTGMIIWVSWYKKASGIKTDITEDVIREIVLPKGWVDIKVCAVSDLWSGLKIVKRKEK